MVVVKGWKVRISNAFQDEVLIENWGRVTFRDERAVRVRSHVVSRRESIGEVRKSFHW